MLLIKFKCNNCQNHWNGNGFSTECPACNSGNIEKFHYAGSGSGKRIFAVFVVIGLLGISSLLLNEIGFFKGNTQDPDPPIKTMPLEIPKKPIEGDGHGFPLNDFKDDVNVQTVEDRIIEIREFYSKIQGAPNKESNCIAAQATRKDERGFHFTNTAKECRLTNGNMYQQVNLNGWEWTETTTFYYKNDQCFFVFLEGASSGGSYEYRVYYDRKGKVIRVLLKQGFDSNEIESSIEVTDKKRKQDILSSIANSKKELRTILSS